MSEAMTAPAQTTSAADLAAVETFLIDEAAMLDRQDFESWLDLFAEDGHYWVPATRNQTSPLNAVSIHYEDKALLQVRIMRLRHPQTESMHPSPQTMHSISNVRIEAVDEENGELVAASHLLMVEYRLDEQRVLAGHCRHRLRRTGQGWKIIEKRVDLLGCDSERGFVRFAIPF
jgi:benzoate/toluate 1,2-dioxygenase beta subunit